MNEMLRYKSILTFLKVGHKSLLVVNIIDYSSFTGYILFYRYKIF